MYLQIEIRTGGLDLIGWMKFNGGMRRLISPSQLMRTLTVWVNWWMRVCKADCTIITTWQREGCHLCRMIDWLQHHRSQMIWSREYIDQSKMNGIKWSKSIINTKTNEKGRRRRSKQRFRVKENRRVCKLGGDGSQIFIRGCQAIRRIQRGSNKGASEAHF